VYSLKKGKKKVKKRRNVWGRLVQASRRGEQIVVVLYINVEQRRYVLSCFSIELLVII
jgi:hypothetical protein